MIVIGGGPSGLSAATRLRALGVPRVAVLEREVEAGGVPRHCGHSPYGLREFGRLMGGRSYAACLVEAAQAAGAEVLTQHTVVSFGPGPDPVLIVTTPSGATLMTARRVVLATGIRETSRAARLLGGDRPLGVMSTGALQAVVYLQRMTPFRRPVVLGTELVSFSALLTCRHAGARPRAMIEPNDGLTARGPARLLPLALGIPLHLGTDIAAIHGATRVEGVTLRDRDGATRTLDCDGAVITGRFTPEAALARMAGWTVDPGTEGPRIDGFGRSLDHPAYFATGNLRRPVETAGWCWGEGQATAAAVAADLERGLPPPDDAVPLTVAGDPLRYVVPQAIHPTAETPDLMPEVAQLRLSRPARGTLIAEQDGRTLWSRRLDSRPERRITVPLRPMIEAVEPGGPMTFRLREAP
ncbi:NAD(P)-binding protein [Roseospira navarrensis]|uniref:NAD(P)-binding protein n=1 Tax=Roseospira navarrensis TaxID=140058 RepID=A0A7X2D200_9PROT|nr:NAD(P)-binding protein [Roseospira navarrensis]